jgi:hypothetical protein
LNTGELMESTLRLAVLLERKFLQVELGQFI